MAVKTLDEMDKKIPVAKIPLDPMLRYQVADLYFRAGATERFRTISADIEKEMLKMIENNPNDVMREFNPYSILTQIYERNKDYQKLVGLYEQLMRLYPQDPNLKGAYEMYKSFADSLNKGK
jgi:tetratricopeptide (TPR) repeat protein